MEKIYELHNIDTPYIAPNYKEALRQLVADPPADERPKRKGVVTFAGKVNVHFPK